MQLISISYICSHSFAFQEWLRYRTYSEQKKINKIQETFDVCGTISLPDLW